MAWTADELAAIDKAIANGKTTVTFRDRTATWRSLDELLKIRKLIRAELGLDASGGRGFSNRGQYAKTDKGT